MMFLYLWLMLLLVVGWITATDFSGASPRTIYGNYSTSKIVPPELYLTPVDITPVLKKLHWLPVEQRMVFKTATLAYKFLHIGFLGILLHIFLITSVLTAPGTAKVVAISLSFQSSTLLFINLSSSLVIVFAFDAPLFGMFFQMRFVPLHPWPLSESSLKPTCTPKHTHLSLDHPLVFSVVLDPSSVSGY